MTLFTLPTSRRVTQDWGQDFNWLNGKFYPSGFYASIGWLGHNGIDYGCPLNDNVESVCDGVVEYVGPGNNHPLLSGGGNVVLIRNDEMQMRFEYLHLAQQNVYTGQKVTRGQVIAQSGNTGTSTAPHLHLGAIPVRPNLNNGYRGRVDPTGWLYGPSNPDYAGIAAAGTITPASAPVPQEDELSAAAEAQISRVLQILEAQESDNIRQRIVAIDDRTATSAVKYLKGDQDATLYEFVGGKLRGIGLVEWQATGQGYRTLPQDIINALPKA